MILEMPVKEKDVVMEARVKEFPHVEWKDGA